MPTSSWSVSVERNGENVVTIGHNHLSGRDLSPEDEDVIRDAADHLLAFIGKKRRERACLDPKPSWFTGRWRDWHRGHGCDLDDGKPRSDAALAEIAARGGA